MQGRGWKGCVPPLSWRRDGVRMKMPSGGLAALWCRGEGMLQEQGRLPEQARGPQLHFIF